MKIKIGSKYRRKLNGCVSVVIGRKGNSYVYLRSLKTSSTTHHVKLMDLDKYWDAV